MPENKSQRKLSVFNFVTLNGYFKGQNEDISWHRHALEEDEYADEMLQHDTILLFGRITYEMMAAYWPTESAMENDPEVAKGMNQSEKIVFSRTLKKAEWASTEVIRDNMVEVIRKMKQTPGKNLTILGSGSIVTQFAEAGLIDEYQVMIDPVVIGNGTSLMKDVHHKIDLRLTSTRTFKSGVVLLCYQPIEEE